MNFSSIGIVSFKIQDVLTALILEKGLYCIILLAMLSFLIAYSHQNRDIEEIENCAVIVSGNPLRAVILQIFFTSMHFCL